MKSEFPKFMGPCGPDLGDAMTLLISSPAVLAWVLTECIDVPAGTVGAPSFN
jgi:hypothetical protein